MSNLYIPFPFFLIVILLLHINAISSTDSPSPPLTQALPGCPDKCGDLTVPYPFGISDHCVRDKTFLLHCNTTFDPPRLFINALQNEGFVEIQVTNITSDYLTISFTQFTRECNPPLLNADNKSTTFFGLEDDRPYVLSSTQNKLIVLGCDSLGLFTTDGDVVTGCLSVCSNTSVIENGTCSGGGCCEATLRSGAKDLAIFVSSISDHNTTRNISNCTVAFPVEEDKYNFTYADLVSFKRPEVPVVLEWSVGNESCSVANTSTEYACVGGEGKTRCVNSHSRDGYRCHCIDGYQGNPYIHDGCQDIDECLDTTTHSCLTPPMCTNTPGNYTCSCPKGSYGDGRKDGKGCNKNNPNFPLAAKIIIGIALSVMIIMGAIISLYLVKKKRNYIQQRQEYFEKNGGLLLQQKKMRGNVATIFTEDELKVATDGFNESRVLGKGGNGTVYMGYLPDSQGVAIKKSKIVEEAQKEEFINEIAILTQVIHKNVVKIVGCCLETQVPLLVYEYIPNGTLFEHIHPKDGQPSKLSWNVRLHIAAETAGAIAYLHSDLNERIIHRDIKSANILLDHGFTAKVADFGASRLAPADEVEVATMVQGTLGYLDPEYLQTSHLTDKSDVYSFGVVLGELLTGEKSTTKKGNQLVNLAMDFLLSMKEDRFVDILDPKVKEGDTEQVMVIAQIAKRCLAAKGEERPTMKEVAAELDRVRGFDVKSSHAINEDVLVNNDEQWRGRSFEIENTQSSSYSGSTTRNVDMDWSVNLHR